MFKINVFSDYSLVEEIKISENYSIKVYKYLDDYESRYYYATTTRKDTVLDFKICTLKEAKKLAFSY